MLWILNGKENKEAGGILFLVKDAKETNQQIIMEWFDIYQQSIYW